MLNKCQFIGNVAREPEIRYTGDNKPIANLSIGVSEKYKDKNGDKKENTEWVRVVVFGGLAGVVEKYVKKGDKLYVEGKFKTRKWTDKEGKDQYTTEIVVDGFGGSLQMLGGKPEGKSPAMAPAYQSEPVDDDMDSDTIPF